MRNDTNLSLHIIPSHKYTQLAFKWRILWSFCTADTLNFLNNAFFGVWLLNYLKSRFGAITSWLNVEYFVWLKITFKRNMLLLTELEAGTRSPYE